MARPQGLGGLPDRPLKGIAFAVAWVGGIGMVDALAKWLVVENSTFQLLAIRSAFVLVLLIPLIRRAGGLSALVTHRPLPHLARLGLTTISIFSFFEALRHLPLATTTTLAFSSPLFMTILSHFLLGERVGPHRWFAVGVGFLGVVLIARPGGEVADTGAAMLAVLSGLTYASSLVVVRWTSRTETDMSFVFYNNLGSLTFGLAALPFVWKPPTALDVGLIGAMAVVLILAQIFMVRAFRYASVATVAPFQYGELVIAALIGLLVWGEFPGVQVWVGAAIIVAAGLYVTLREARGVVKIARSTVSAAPPAKVQTTEN
jgi:drug/metabolite transporter (DMT)-like permease